MGGFSQRIYKRERCKHEAGRRYSAGGICSAFPLADASTGISCMCIPLRLLQGKTCCALNLGSFFFFFVSAGGGWRARAGSLLSEQPCLKRYTFFKWKNLEIPPWLNGNEERSDGVVQPLSCRRAADGSRHVTLAHRSAAERRSGCNNS